jgi:hypothetical protein
LLQPSRVSCQAKTKKEEKFITGTVGEMTEDKILESIIDWMENNEWFATGVTVNKIPTSLAQQARQNPELRKRLIAERNRGMCQ